MSRLSAALKDALKKIPPGRLAIFILVLPLFIYVYREATRDVLTIDPFSVPKQFEEAGLTSEVMANRIGGTLRQIEVDTQTTMKKDNLGSVHDEASMPDVEIPGTNLGLKTVVDITRTVFGINPKHISGDIVLPVNPGTDGVSSPVKQQATVTIYLTQGRNRSAPVSIAAPADDVGILVQLTAQSVLGQVNPYLMARYRERHHEYDKAIEILVNIIQDPSEDLFHKQNAYDLWGIVFHDQKKYDQAIAKYQQSIELDPKDADGYGNWGVALLDQKKYDQAIAKFQKAIGISPKKAIYYDNWGNALLGQQNDDEAIAKLREAIRLDPKNANFYNDWGAVLDDQKKYDEAIAKFRKAIELDPKNANVYFNWGFALAEQKKYDEAIAEYQKAIEVDPKNFFPYGGWGLALRAQGKEAEATVKLNKAAELSRAQ
jgi:tetratricopeptide (TPR) repeat protein